MKESIRLMRDLLLVREVKPELLTLGGIWMPQQIFEDRDLPAYWDVMEIGPMVTDVRPGDRIVTFRNTMGQNFDFNGEHLHIIRYKNVGCVLEASQ